MTFVVLKFDILVIFVIFCYISWTLISEVLKKVLDQKIKVIFDLHMLALKLVLPYCKIVLIKSNIQSKELRFYNIIILSWGWGWITNEPIFVLNLELALASSDDFVVPCHLFLCTRGMPYIHTEDAWTYLGFGKEAGRVCCKFSKMRGHRGWQLKVVKLT